MFRPTILRAATAAIALAGTLAVGQMAYADTSPKSLTEYSSVALEAYTEAKASFAAGVSSHLYPGKTSNRDLQMIRTFNINPDSSFYAAGVAFQEENQMTSKEVKEFLSIVAAELKNHSFMVRVNDGVEFHKHGISNGVDLVDAARFLGILESAGDDMSVDRAVTDHLKELIDAQPPGARDDLMAIAETARSNAWRLSSGHSSFWHEVAAQMDAQPVGAVSFATIDPFETEEPEHSSKLAGVDTP